MSKEEFFVLFNDRGFEDEYGFLCVEVEGIVYSFENGKVYCCV